MKIKFAAVALLLSSALCCSDSFGTDLLNRMLGRGGCGCDAAPTCCDTPAPACSGRTLSFNLNIGLPGRGLLAGLRDRGCGGDSCGTDCGCGAPAGGCGCDAPMAASCDSGCGNSGGLLSGMFQGARCGGCGLFKGGIGNGCGCDLMASTPCESACDQMDACGSQCGLFKGRLRGRMSGLFNRGSDCGTLGSACGCDAPAASCGCDAPAASCDSPAPFINAAPSCGCDAPAAAGCGCENAPACGCNSGMNIRGRMSNVLARLPRPLQNRNCGCGAPAGTNCGCGAAVANDCGCNGAAVANDCGCNGAAMVSDCGCGSSRMTLMDRLRGRRNAGNACGCGSSDGCDASCPNSGCGCNGGSAPAMNFGNVPVDNNSVIASPTMAPADVAPMAAPVEPVQSAPVDGGAAVPSSDGAYRSRTPMVDPNAFIIRNAGYRN